MFSSVWFFYFSCVSSEPWVQYGEQPPWYFKMRYTKYITLTYKLQNDTLILSVLLSRIGVRLISRQSAEIKNKVLLRPHTILALSFPSVRREPKKDTTDTQNSSLTRHSLMKAVINLALSFSVVQVQWRFIGISVLKYSAVINECERLFLTGHAIWLETFTSMPSYIVPDSDGNYTPSVLAGFYMFFTMIILLQVRDLSLARH